VPADLGFLVVSENLAGRLLTMPPQMVTESFASTIANLFAIEETLVLPAGEVTRLWALSDHLVGRLTTEPTCHAVLEEQQSR